MGVVGAAVLCLLVDLIMPEGSTKKHIRSIMAIITLFIILSPLPSLLNQNWEIDNIFGSNNIKPDNRIVDNVHTQQITLLEESLENKLSEDGYNDSKVIISAYSKENVIKIKAVSVDLSLCGVTASDYEKVKQKVQIYLDDNNILVVVYG
jgi:hypothetical protein